MIGQVVSTAGAAFLVERFAAFLAALASSAALAGADSGSFFGRASRRWPPGSWRPEWAGVA